MHSGFEAALPLFWLRVIKLWKPVMLLPTSRCTLVHMAVLVSFLVPRPLIAGACFLDSQATRRSAALPTPYVGVGDTGDDDGQGQGQRLSRAERIREQQLHRNRARTAKKQDEDVDPMVSGPPGICRSMPRIICVWAHVG